jgi:hypothetical protein
MQIKSPYAIDLPTPARIPMGSPSKTLKPLNSWMPPGFAVNFAFALRRALIGLADRIVPTSLPLFEKSMGMMDTVTLSIAARYEIADLLAESPQTAASMASRQGIHAEHLHRVLRALASRGIFTLDKEGRFHNNRLSKSLLKANATANREWAQYFGSQSNMLAWLNLPNTMESGAGSFDQLFGMTVWDWFEKHPDEQEMFAHSMMGVTALQAPIIARAYPFAEIQTLCDIGGGRGTLLSEILIHHKNLKGILLDAPGVLQSAEALLQTKGVESRVERVPGNFLDRIPLADAYTLKNIFHDWDDAFCSRILQTLKKTIQPGQKVLVIEQLVEHNSSLGVGPASDAQMMVVCSGGKERSQAEIQELLLQNGFRLGRTFHHPIVSIIEGVAPEDASISAILSC